MRKSGLGAFKIDKLEQASSIDFTKLGIDFDEVVELVENGAVGEIVNVVSQNGDIITVYVVIE